MYMGGDNANYNYWILGEAFLRCAELKMGLRRGGRGPVGSMRSCCACTHTPKKKKINKRGTGFVALAGWHGGIRARKGGEN